MTRWGQLLTTITVLASVSCAQPAAPVVAVPASALHLTPISDLIKAPGLVWLACATPRAFMLAPDLAIAEQWILSEERLARFRSRSGGIDPRTLDEVCIAQYTDSRIIVGRGNLDPGRVEAAFRNYAGPAEARTVTHENEGGANAIVQVFGHGRGELVQLALFGRAAFALEEGPGRVGLRAAVAFSEAKLSRAKPALKALPLADAAGQLGDAAGALYYPGPFDGRAGDALGGLVRACTAVAIRMRVVELNPLILPSGQTTAGGTPGDAPKRLGFAFRLYLLGDFHRDPGGAAARLAAAYDLLTHSDLGKLLTLDKAALAPRVAEEGGALALDVTYEAEALARGIHHALDSEISEIVGQPSSSSPD